MNGLRNIRELADIFQEVKDIFAFANSKRRFDRIGQLSWQTFIRDARSLKYKVPLDPNTNNVIPQNCNVQVDNVQANLSDKPNNNTNIQDNNSRVGAGQQQDQSNYINSKKSKRKSSTMPNKNNRKNP